MSISISKRAMFGNAALPLGLGYRRISIGDKVSFGRNVLCKFCISSSRRPYGSYNS